MTRTVSTKMPWLTFLLALAAFGIAGYAVAFYLTGHPLAPAFVQGKIQLERFVPTPLWTAALVIHAAGGSLALLAGGLQWLGLRWRRGRHGFRRFHVIIGLLYAAGIAAGSAGGLVLAPQATGGWVSAAGFGLLDLLWIATTARAVWLGAALRRQPAGAEAPLLRVLHRGWMIRSFALTAAAITLRVWLPLAMAAGLDFLASYQVIAWLCWVPNLVLAELLIGRRR